MRRERGFVWYVYLIIAVAVVGFLWSAAAWFDSRGYDRGVAETKGKWAEANEAAEAEHAADRAADQKIIRDQAVALMRSMENATIADQRWQEARNDARRNRTALAVCPPPSTATGTEPGRAPAADGPRFTWLFVQLYDTAWTGRDGEPVFADRPLAEAARLQAGAASPYSADDLIDVHGTNAARCSTDRRRLDSLVETLDRLEREWDERHPRP